MALRGQRSLGMQKTIPGLAVRTSVKERRVARGWGQEELAAKAGMSTTTIHNLEAEKNGFTDKSLSAIAEALGCTPAELLLPIDATPPHVIRGDAQILSMLARIEGLTSKDIDVAFGVIQLALAKRGG
ncbi:XRE family transcriptional regulator [bacterium M00.F.Ca.ET.141.01.1.1]|nr:XRE family transcriptional regulator [bacterium M00.F.Ca.ET.141.01.1.1]